MRNVQFFKISISLFESLILKASMQHQYISFNSNEIGEETPFVHSQASDICAILQLYFLANSSTRFIISISCFPFDHICFHFGLFLIYYRRGLTIL